MTDHAAAVAPATEDVVDNTPIELQEPTEDDVLSQAFDKAQESEEQVVDETPEEPVVEAVEQDNIVEIPTDVPASVKAIWGNLDEAARDAVMTPYRELATKYGDVNRDMQAVAPLRDVIHRAAQEIPGVRDMTPQQLAQEVYQLAQVSQAVRTNPEQAFLGLAKQHNIDLAKLAGVTAQEPNEAAQLVNELRGQVAQLQGQLQSFADPNRMQQQFAHWSTEQAVTNEVNDFAAKSEHWQAVEPHLPATIPVAQAKLGPSATPSQVLQEAYQLAVNTFVPNAKAAETVAGDEPAPEAPQRVEAAVKAKSVNVRSKPGSDKKPANEDDALAAVWERMQSE